MIGDVIDFGQEGEGMLVQQGVSQDLDQLKATYQALPDYLTQARWARARGWLLAGRAACL